MLPDKTFYNFIWILFFFNEHLENRIFFARIYRPAFWKAIVCMCECVCACAGGAAQGWWWGAAAMREGRAAARGTWAIDAGLVARESFACDGQSASFLPFSYHRQPNRWPPSRKPQPKKRADVFVRRKKFDVWCIMLDMIGDSERYPTKIKCLLKTYLIYKYSYNMCEIYHNYIE